ncbi:MAG: Gfo/Idh/MocA family oxidoreductase [Limnochordaceae bacterium]|nr:Gfo/Idh/MocA family oxidoreductase [Limnochordaceae bacterium]
MTLTFGVIGAGDFGERHLQVLAAHPSAEIAWVCDRDAGRAQQMAERYGGRPTTDLAEVLQDPAVQAVSVLTPEHVHCEQVLAALAAGKDVLVEKPVTTSAQEAAALQLKVRETGRIVMPAHISRFIPSYAKAREYLGPQGLGNPVSIHARRNVPRERLALHNRIHPVFMALSHDIDLVLSYVKSEPRRVVAMERKTDPALQNPDIFWGLVEFENGCIAALETLWVLPNSACYVDAAMEIATPGGVVHVRYPSDALWLDLPQGHAFPDPAIFDTVNGEIFGALRDEISYFIRCVERREEPSVVTLQDAVTGLRIAEALVTAARERREVRLEAGAP